MSFPVEVVTDGRDFVFCHHCGYAGVGYVAVLSTREAVGTCDVCGRSSVQDGSE